ncbi:S-adenosyl-L-methionine-dependent methyltransferase [Artomyces pyxidatus]|uniref:S-adenosyl-L-methionine-dependent methyltransferase n=1 Tax=Artomyces pyxidatus TaxID=48021 RepID=A0ACB8SMU6_9AGAM|nr:S-adenosyl-L-methionine-dependent methyltransferase [Artomyces pyxidatus]
MSTSASSDFLKANPDVKNLRTIISDKPESWDEAWKLKVTPWDAGEAQPPLRDLLESSRLPLPTSGKALVPGCGKAYDAFLIASTLGLNTVAIDISETAIDAAKELLASTSGLPEGKVSIEKGDFFAMSLPESERYDLIYDYTFFVAIPPSRRIEWGRQMSALAKPGAYLIALVFPLNLSPDEGGPPHFVKAEHYDEPLAGWTKVLDEIPRSSPTHIGRDQLLVWKKD